MIASYGSFGYLWGHTYSIAGFVLGFIALLWVVTKLLHRRQTYSELAEDYGIYGVVGRMGGGKTYLLAWMGCRALEAGREVGANFSLEHAGRQARRLDSWTDVLGMPKGSLVLLHEMHLCWPVSVTRPPAVVPIPEESLTGVQNWATQVRKRTMTVLWDSQYWTQVSLMFRKLTFRVWFGERAYRAHNYKLYDSTGFSEKARPRLQVLASMFVKRREDVQSSYDTKEIAEGFGAWWEAGYVPPRRAALVRDAAADTPVAAAVAFLGGRPLP